MIRGRWALPVAAFAVAIFLAGCGTQRGPDYGVAPQESKALAVPPDVTAEPLAVENPYPSLADTARFRSGPLAVEGDGEWAARVKGSTLLAPVPTGWAQGVVRAALVLHGIDVAQEREGALRTGWLDAEAHKQLGAPPPAVGEARYTFRFERKTAGVTRILAQGVVRSGDDMGRSDGRGVEAFLKALQPAFGRQPTEEGP